MERPAVKDRLTGRVEERPSDDQHTRVILEVPWKAKFLATDSGHRDLAGHLCSRTVHEGLGQTATLADTGAGHERDLERDLPATSQHHSQNGDKDMCTVRGLLSNAPVTPLMFWLSCP